MAVTDDTDVMAPCSWWHRRIPDWRDDRGMLGGVEALPFGILIFVSMSLMVMNLWAVIDTRMALNAAAREAAHAAAEAPNGTEAETRADDAAHQTLANFGRNASRLGPVRPAYGEPTGDPVVGPGGFARCRVVSVNLAYDVPLINVPFVGGFGPSAQVSTRHAEVVDPFRSAVAGTATC